MTSIRISSNGRYFIDDAGKPFFYLGDTAWLLFQRLNPEEIEEYLDKNIYIAPTYGNTLMGLAASAPSGPENNYKITYHAPQPRAVIEVVDFDDAGRIVEYGQSGRVKLTTLTKEFFVPRFAERDEGERERPIAKYPWDGVSGVRPYHEFAASTTVGVY